MSLSGIILFVIILLVLVIIHELGHFIAAKMTGMRVDEFAFGFPPKLFSYKKGETTYAINAIPLGGYVAILGENGSEEDRADGGARSNPRAFSNRPWWAQIITLLAGVTMNMLLAWIIFMGISYGTIPVSVDDEIYGARARNTVLTVVDAAPASPAYMAGITPGSVILKMTSNGSIATLTSATSAIAFVEKHQNDPLYITYTNPEGVIASTTIAAVYGIVPNKKAIGLILDVQGTFRTTFIEAVSIGTKRTYDMTVGTFDGLVSVVKSLVHGNNVLSSLSGPVGIAKIVGQQSAYGAVPVLSLVAVLSINLAILNILPFPALDGGRIIIVAAETVTRRKFPVKWMMIVNGVGFSLLILLLIAVTIKDIFY
jgi:regulator of sigma E protease